MGIFDKGDSDEGGEVIDATQRIAERIVDDAGDVPVVPEAEAPALEAVPDPEPVARDTVGVRVIVRHNGIPRGAELQVSPDRADKMIASGVAELQG